MTMAEAAVHIWLAGRVQGVGVRPFVYRLAQRFNLKGWVRNRSGQVEIQALGDPQALTQFQTALLREAPSPAIPEIVSCTATALFDCNGFSILDSAESTQTDVHLPPDYSICDDCLRELYDPHNRRYHYPFTTCAHCGPRYSLIERLPYDRSNTGMAGFPLCADCRAEYDNPLDRRFHAESLACPACGPQLTFVQDGSRGNGGAALTACVAELRAGKIVAVKGVGGYHLLCDARADNAVARLRERKMRPHKPLAVMFPQLDNLEQLRQTVELDAESERALLDPVRPIVLCKRRYGTGVSELSAPGLDEIGAMLPYSPLHHLLLDAVGGPLIATSANLSGEPVLTDRMEAETQLQPIADAFLHHDRPILHRADDPVVRIVAGRAHALRLGRGNAPLELELKYPLSRPTLALGGHSKNTIALGWGKRALISSHIGELGSPRSLAVFEQTVADLQALHGVRAEQIVCDAHPSYASSRWAERAGLPARKIFHHRAHASALAGEFPAVERWLTFTWDGAGFGEDGTLWGGEALLGGPGDWRRVATTRPFRLPGGEKVGREPWRSACALLWETGQMWREAAPNIDVLHHAWARNLNAPVTSSVGRLFDAAAALLGLIDSASYEAQAPMLLEAAARSAGSVQPVPLPLKKNGNDRWEIDWAELLPMLQNAALPIPVRAATFHASLAQALVEVCIKIRDEHGPFTVGLTGGVFQNRLLAETALALLTRAGFDSRIPEQVPANDAGISFGQLVEI